MAKPITPEEMTAYVEATWNKCQGEAWRQPEPHLQAAEYANRRKEAYLDYVKKGLAEKLSEEMVNWLWVAHYEGYRDAIRARGDNGTQG